MATRQTHMRKMFVNADGSVSRSADKGWSALRIELFNVAKDDKGNFVVADTVDFEKAKLTEAMADAAAGYGLSQKLGDSVSGIVKQAADEGFTPDAKTGYATLIKKVLLEGWEDIVNGFWTEEKTEGESGGGSVTIILQGVVAAFKKAGLELTEAKLVALREKLGTKEGREAFMKRPDVKAEVAQIKAERAVAAAKAAADAAAKVDDASAADTTALDEMI